MMFSPVANFGQHPLYNDFGSSTIVFVLHIRQTRQNSFWDVMTTEEQAIGATCWENDTKAKILRPISIFLDGHNINFLFIREMKESFLSIYYMVISKDKHY